jgi:hypothetical protein
MRVLFSVAEFPFQIMSSKPKSNHLSLYHFTLHFNPSLHLSLRCGTNDIFSPRFRIWIVRPCPRSNVNTAQKFVRTNEVGEEKEDEEDEEAEEVEGQPFEDRDETRSWTMREGAVLVRELALFVVYLDVLWGSVGAGYQMV